MMISNIQDMDIDDLEDLDSDDISVEDWDLDNNGQLDADDCPFNHGTAKAAAWWKNVLVPHTKDSITQEMRNEYGNDVVGAYQGKPLVPGQRGPGQGDFDFLVDKLKVQDGYSEETAKRIMGRVNQKLYG